MRIKYIIIILLSACARPAAAQQFPLTVVAAAGFEGTTLDGAYTISHTIGEAIIFTTKGADNALTQGFHQGDRQRCWSLTGLYPADIQFDAASFDPCNTSSVNLMQTQFIDFSAHWFLNDLPVCDGWSCVGAIDTGINRFSLVLSASGCELFDSDTLVLTRGLAAAPQPDNIEVLQGADPLVLNLIQNDQNLEQNYTLEIINPNPDLITVTTIPQTPGTVFVSADYKAYGNYEFFYKICNQGFCQECNTGRVAVFVERLVGEGYNNGITPNGDGLNDVFVLCQSCPTCPPCEKMELWIYNRWGSVIFEDNDYDNNWDGKTSAGQELPAGTYPYYATINRIVRTGTITIIR